MLATHKLRLLVLDRPLNLLSNFYEHSIKSAQRDVPIEHVFGTSVPQGRGLLLGQPWNIIVLRHDFFSQAPRQLERLIQRQRKLEQKLPLILLVANAPIELHDSLQEFVRVYPFMVFVLRKNLPRALPQSIVWAVGHQHLTTNAAVQRKEAIQP